MSAILAVSFLTTTISSAAASSGPSRWTLAPSSLFQKEKQEDVDIERAAETSAPPIRCLFFRVVRPDAYSAVPEKDGAPFIFADPAFVREKVPHALSAVNQDTKDFMSYFANGVTSAMTENFAYAYDFPQFLKQLREYSPAKIAERKSQIDRLARELRETRAVIMKEREYVAGRFQGDEEYVRGIIRHYDVMIEALEKVASGALPVGVGAYEASLAVESGVGSFLKDAAEIVRRAGSGETVPPELLERARAVRPFLYLTAEEKKQLQELGATLRNLKQNFPEGPALQALVKEYLKDGVADRKEFEQAVAAAFALSVDYRPRERTLYRITVVLLDRSPRLFMSYAVGNDIVIGINRAAFSIKHAKTRRAVIMLDLYHELAKMLQRRDENKLEDFQALLGTDTEFFDYVLSVVGMTPEAFVTALKKEQVVDDNTTELLASMLWGKDLSLAHLSDDRKFIAEYEKKHRQHVNNPGLRAAFDQIGKSAAKKRSVPGEVNTAPADRDAYKEIMRGVLARNLFGPFTVSPRAEEAVQVDVPPAGQPFARQESVPRHIFHSVMKKGSFSSVPVRGKAAVDLAGVPTATVTLSSDDVPVEALLARVEEKIAENSLSPDILDGYMRLILRYSPGYVGQEKRTLRRVARTVRDHARALKSTASRYDPEEVEMRIAALKAYALKIDEIVEMKAPTGMNSEKIDVRMENDVDRLLGVLEAAVAQAEKERKIDPALILQVAPPADCVALTRYQLSRIQKIDKANAPLIKKVPACRAVDEATSGLARVPLLTQLQLEALIMRPFTVFLPSLPLGRTHYTVTCVFVDRSERLFTPVARGNDLVLYINKSVLGISDARVRRIFVQAGLFHEMCRFVNKSAPGDEAAVMDNLAVHVSYLLDEQLEATHIDLSEYYKALVESNVVDVPSVEFLVGCVIRARCMRAAEDGDRRTVEKYERLLKQFQTTEFRDAYMRCIDLIRLITEGQKSVFPAGMFDIERAREKQKRDEAAKDILAKEVEFLIRKGVSGHLYGIPPLELSGDAVLSAAEAGEGPAETPAALGEKPEIPVEHLSAESVPVEPAVADTEPAAPQIDPVLEQCRKVADRLKDYEEALQLLLKRPTAGELTVSKIVSKPQKGSPQIVVQITGDSAMPSAGQYLLLKSKLFKAAAVYPDRREAALVKVDAEGAQIKDGVVLRLGLKDEDVRPVERQIRQVQGIRQRLKDKTTGSAMLDRLFGVAAAPVASDVPLAEIPQADYLFALNDSQIEAVRASMGAAEVVYIDGVYKTGKTMTLAEIMYQSFNADRKVLFISPVKPDNDPSLKEIKGLLGEDHFYEYPRIYKGERGCVQWVTARDLAASAGKGIGMYETVVVDDGTRDVMLDAFAYLRPGGTAVFARSEKGSPLFYVNVDEMAYLAEAVRKKPVPVLDGEAGVHVVLREKMYQTPVLAALSDLIAGRSDGAAIKPDEVKPFQLRVSEVSGDDAVNVFVGEIVKQLREYREKGIPPNDISIVVPGRLEAEYLDGLLRIQHLRNYVGIKDDTQTPRIATVADGMSGQNKAVILALAFCQPRDAVEFIKKHGRLLASESLALLYDPSQVSGDEEKGFYEKITGFYARVAQDARKPAALPKDIVAVFQERTITPAALAVESGSPYVSSVAMKSSAGVLKPFAFVKQALDKGTPEYIVTAEIGDGKSLAVKWGDELEELVKSMGISSKEIQGLVQSVLLMTGGDAHKIPKSINLILLDCSSHLAEYFTRTHTVGLNRAFENMSVWGRKAIFMAALYDILAQILSPETPPAGSLARLGSYLSDILRDNRISMEELWREMKRVAGPGGSASLLEVVRCEESRGVLKREEQLRLELSPPAGKYDRIFTSYLDACEREGLISAVQKKFIRDIVFADNPHAGWDIEGIKQLVKFVNDPHIKHFSKILGPGGRPVKMLPRYELDLVLEFKDAENIGALLKKIPFDELYYDTGLDVNTETEKTLKEKAGSAAGVIQGALTELFHARCLKISEKKPVTGFSLPLGKLGAEWTEVDTIMSPEEGIVESKSRGDFYVKEKTGVRETIDSIIGGKLQKLQDSVANGHLSFLKTKKVTFTFNRRVLNIIANQIVESMKQDDPLADIYIDFTNKLPKRELGADLEGTLRAIRKNEGLQTVTVNADDMIACIKNRYTNHPSGWEIEIKLFPNVVFLRDNITPREYEAGKERVRAADEAMEKVLKEYDRKIATIFGVPESQIGTLPATLEYDELKIGEAVDKYGVSILAVDAKGKEIEQASKWLAQRDLLKTDGYLRVVEDLQEALKPFRLNLGWMEYLNDPGQNPKRKLIDYIMTAKPALADIIQMVRKVRDAVAAAQQKRQLTAQIEFICDSGIGTPLVKKMEGSKQILQFNIPQIIGQEDLIDSLLTSPAAELAKAEYLTVKEPYYSEQSIKDGRPVKFANPDEAKVFGGKLVAFGRAVKETVTVEGRTFDVIIEKGSGLTAEAAAAQISEALSRTRAIGGDISKLPQTLVFALLDQSQTMFEDHIRNGFIGINRALLTITDEKVRSLLLKVGIFHELCHEVTGLSGEVFENAQLGRDALYAAALIRRSDVIFMIFKSTLQLHLEASADMFVQAVAHVLLSNLYTQGKLPPPASFWQKAKDFGFLKLAALSVIPAAGIVYYYLTVKETPQTIVPVKPGKEIVEMVPSGPMEKKLPAAAQGKVLRRIPSDADRLTDTEFIQRFAVPREARYFNEVSLPGAMSWDHVQLLVDDEYGQPDRPPAGLQASAGKVSDYTAASKESLHIAYLLNLITGRPALRNIQLSPTEAEGKMLSAIRLEATTQNVAKLRLLEKLKIHLKYGKLMPWVSVRPDGSLKPTTDFIPALDNGQTTWSLLAVVGALQDKKDPLSADIVKTAEDVLKLHDYAPFLNKRTGLLHAEVNNDLSERGGYQLNDMYEGTMAVLYGVLTGQVPESAWDNIVIETVPYTTADGETIDVLKGYRASMHELWALGWIPYLESPLAPVLKNFAYAHMDSARRNGLPGVGATCYTSKGYQQVGLRAFASHPGDREDVATAYATAMLMLVDRGAGLMWFRTLYGYPGMAGSYGIIESVAPNGYANILTTDSKGLVLLSLTGGLNDEVNAYLKTHTVPGTQQTMYDKLMELIARKHRQLMEGRKGAPLRTAARPYPQPPENYFGVTLVTDPVVPPEYDVTGALKFEHHHGLHVGEDWQNPNGGITISYRIPGDDPEKFAWKGTFVPPVNISKMRYVSVTVPADTPRYVFDLELKNSIRDFILAHAIVDTSATEDTVLSLDGKWKTIVCRIRPIKASKLNDFDYFSVAIDDPAFKNMPDVGKFDIRGVKLTQANPITGAVPAPVTEAVQVPGENDIFPYITWPHGGLAIRKDRERETVIFTDRLSGEGKWKGGFIAPPLDLGRKYAGGHINLLVRNLRQGVAAFEFELKNDAKNLLGGKFHAVVPVTPDWQVIQVPLPDNKDMIANYLAFSDVAGRFELGAITFDAAPAGPTLPVAPVKVEYMQVKGAYYSADSMKDGEKVAFADAAAAKAFGEKLLTAGKALKETVTVEGRNFDVIIEQGSGLTAKAVKAQISEALARTRDIGGDIKKLPQTLVFALLDTSSHMFEDHIANGFIGINRTLFEIKDEKIRNILLQVGIFHELCHEVTGLSGAAFEKTQLTRDAEYGFGLTRVIGLDMNSIGPVLRKHFETGIIDFIDALNVEALSKVPAAATAEAGPLFAPLDIPRRSISDEESASAIVGSDA